MPNINDMFPPRFISPRDVAKIKKADQTFVIREIVREEGLNPKTKKKEVLWVCYFMGTQKGHRLRKSEIRTLAAAFGEETEKWTDKEVVLYSVHSQVGDGVRMKPAKATAETEQTEDK